ncbi:MAG: NPXTG-anchored protein, partial [Clostridia bacterium]|nr:NPXTG-anchored protein [Clostridia bacterium]
ATTGTTEAKTGGSPNTGDSNAIGLFIALAVLSIGGVVVVSKSAKEQTSK